MLVGIPLKPGKKIAPQPWRRISNVVVHYLQGSKEVLSSHQTWKRRRGGRPSLESRCPRKRRPKRVQERLSTSQPHHRCLSSGGLLRRSRLAIRPSKNSLGRWLQQGVALHVETLNSSCWSRCYSACQTFWAADSPIPAEQQGDGVQKCCVRSRGRDDGPPVCTLVKLFTAEEADSSPFLRISDRISKLASRHF